MATSHLNQTRTRKNIRAPEFFIADIDSLRQTPKKPKHKTLAILDQIESHESHVSDYENEEPMNAREIDKTQKKKRRRKKNKNKVKRHNHEESIDTNNNVPDNDDAVNADKNAAGSRSRKRTKKNDEREGSKRKRTDEKDRGIKRATKDDFSEHNNVKSKTKSKVTKKKKNTNTTSTTPMNKSIDKNSLHRQSSTRKRSLADISAIVPEGASPPVVDLTDNHGPVKKTRYFGSFYDGRTYGSGIEPDVQYPSRYNHRKYYSIECGKRLEHILEVNGIRRNNRGISIEAFFWGTVRPLKIEHHELWLFTNGPQALVRYLESNAHKPNVRSLQENPRCDEFISAILAYTHDDAPEYDPIIKQRREQREAAMRQDRLRPHLLGLGSGGDEMDVNDELEILDQDILDAPQVDHHNGQNETARQSEHHPSNDDDDDLDNDNDDNSEGIATPPSGEEVSF